MNEEIPNRSDDFPRENSSSEEWQAPPPPKDNSPVAEPPQMSEAGTLGSIFFEPGATFEDLRRKPRFVTAMIICAALLVMFSFAFTSKIGYERIVRESMEASSWYKNQPPDMQKKMIEQQTNSPVMRYISMAIAPIAVVVIFFLGGLIYWGAANAMGGSMTYLRGVAVYVYASFPPWVVSMLANILILFLKSPDDIEAVRGQQGLIQANPSFFIDTKAQPVLGAVLGTFDVFFIWGWILAAIGLRIVGKISTGAAWAIVLLCALVNIAARVIGALFQG